MYVNKFSAYTSQIECAEKKLINSIKNNYKNIKQSIISTSLRKNPSHVVPPNHKYNFYRNNDHDEIAIQCNIEQEKSFFEKKNEIEGEVQNILEAKQKVEKKLVSSESDNCTLTTKLNMLQLDNRQVTRMKL